MNNSDFKCHLSFSFCSFSRLALQSWSRSSITWSAHDGMDTWFLTQSLQINLLQSTHFFLTSPFAQISQPGEYEHTQVLYVGCNYSVHVQHSRLKSTVLTLVGADASSWRHWSRSAAFVDVNQTGDVEVLTHVLHTARDTALRTRDLPWFAATHLLKNNNKTISTFTFYIEVPVSFFQ